MELTFKRPSLRTNTDAITVLPFVPDNHRRSPLLFLRLPASSSPPPNPTSLLPRP